MNEMCQFTGAFCNSLHCDELGHLCRVSYRLGDRYGSKAAKQNDVNERSEEKDVPYDDDGYLCGETGCGLCALYALREVGITHLKLVGRGNYVDFMEKDIRNLRKALTILAASVDEPDYQKQLKRNLFPYGCSRNCYYAS